MAAYAFGMVIELTKEDELRLKDMAALSQRPEADIAREAMHWFLSEDQSHSELIATSRREIEQGRTVDHDALFAEIESMIAQQ